LALGRQVKLRLGVIRQEEPARRRPVNPACITGRLTDHGRGDLMADAAE
jgi:hypothetical protein